MVEGEGSSELDEEHEVGPQVIEPKEVPDSRPVTPERADREPEEDEVEDTHDDTNLTNAPDSESDTEEEEPRLKYAPLTKNLGSVYKGGDATSAFMVAGDKLVIGTHNGKIHVYSMPMLQVVKSYGAHTASVSSVSISPYPPPLPIPTRPDASQRLAAESAGSPSRSGSPSASPNPKQTPRGSAISRSPSNDIHIATSSIDGHVCVQSLVDPRDVQLRNFGRPVQAVALSPEYKSDKSYLSGGQEGNLILTTGGQPGKSANATTLGASAAASGWLGSIGLGANTGTDRILHSGEGIISTVKFSLSGKYVIWVNEQGIKIARSQIGLDSAETDLAWRRISHVGRPGRTGWEEMAAVQRARAEWVDRASLDSDEDPALRHSANGGGVKASSQTGVEEVVVGWGDMTWIIRVTPGDGGSIAKDAAPAGRAEVISVIRFDDCKVAGATLYTPTLLLVLAYMQKKASKSTKSDDSTPRSRSKRHNGLKPELRLIDINTHEELETDALSVSRFETLTPSDYHMGVLYPLKIPAQLVQRGYLGQVGSGMAAVGSGLVTGTEVVAQGVWDATMYGPRMLGANKLFNQSETGSVRSGKAGTDRSPVPPNKSGNYLTGWIPGLGSSIWGAENEELKSVATTQGLKIFLISPYDCIVAVKRNVSDRIQWLEEQQQYRKAWELLDQHPEAVASIGSSSEKSSPPTPSKASSVGQSTADSVASPSKALKPTLADFFADSASVAGSPKPDVKDPNSIAEKEKRRIGELWLKQLTTAGNWSEAAEVAGKVLNTTTRWEHWTWSFIKNNKIDEISPHIPAMELTPPMSPTVYEVILGYYVSRDQKRFQDLLDQWPSDLFEISAITSAIREQQSNKSKDSEDWRILTACLAKLYLADGHYKEALRCYIRLQDADTAMSLVKDHHLIEAIADDVAGFVLLRIAPQQIKSASLDELDELSSEPIKILVDEASKGVVEPEEVVDQLKKPELRPFQYLYLKHLWQGTGNTAAQTSRQRHRFSTAKLAEDEGRLLVDRFPDLAVELFAQYDRHLLMEFLQISTLYDFSSALKICEKRKYVDEEVYLLSKTGSLKKALYLIIDELQDVSKAIEFAKEQDDKGLWDDLLDYSMSRPRFISGLLAGVGTAIDPITLVKRIPSGIEIEGLKDGLKKMLREYDLQDSISSGAATILSSEVAVNMDILRRDRRRGIKFDVPAAKDKTLNTTPLADQHTAEVGDDNAPKSGHCAICDVAFTADETEMLVGFACGHVYHVACLFKDDTKAPLPGSNEEDEDDRDFGFSRSIATKVTNARLLRERISLIGWCKTCRIRKARVAEVVQ